MTMGKTIVITSGKGGVGKTTCAANLAGALAILHNSVVVVDADIGLRNLDVVLGLENRITYNLVDITSGKCRIKQAVINDERIRNLSIIPASQTMDKTAVTPEQMKELTAQLEDMYDYVLIDCPAGIEHGFKNAVAGAGEAIVVTTPQVSSVRDADKILSLLEKQPLSQISLIINRAREDMMRKGEMISIEDMLDILPVNLIGVIPEDKNIVITANMGAPVVLNASLPSSAAYFDTARRIMGENIPFDGSNRKKTFFKRLAEFYR